MLEKLSGLSSPEKAKELPRLLIHDKEEDGIRSSPHLMEGFEKRDSDELNIVESEDEVIVDFSESDIIDAPESSVRKLSDLQPKRHAKGNIGRQEEEGRTGMAPVHILTAKQARKEERKEKARLKLPLDLQMR